MSSVKILSIDGSNHYNFDSELSYGMSVFIITHKLRLDYTYELITVDNDSGKKVTQSSNNRSSFQYPLTPNESDGMKCIFDGYRLLDPNIKSIKFLITHKK